MVWSHCQAIKSNSPLSSSRTMVSKTQVKPLFVSVTQCQKGAPQGRMDIRTNSDRIVTVRDSILRLTPISLPNILYSVYHKHGLIVRLKFLRGKKKPLGQESQLWLQSGQCSVDLNNSPISVLKNHKRNLFCRQIKQNVKLRLQNWLLLPLCILAFLYNGILWHLQVRRASQQRRVVCLYSFKTELARAGTK